MSDDNRVRGNGQEHERLLASESRYRRLFETAQDGILILDAASGRITEVNPFMLQLLGRSREEFLGRELWEVGLFKDSTANQEAFRELEKEGCIRYPDLLLQTKRGDRREVELTSNVYAEGNRRVIQCNIRDITEREEAEELLREAHSRLSFHVENTPLGVIEWDSEFRVSRWSRSAERIFGWKAEEVIGRRIGDWRFVFVDDLETVEQLSQRQRRGDERHGVSRNRNYSKHGSILYCDWYNSVLLDRSGKLESVLSLVQDVTESKHAEEERTRLLAAEQAARREAEEANRIKDEFLATLSHELRTPLTAIVGWARLLSTGEIDPLRYPQALESVIRNAKSQGQLIDDLLDVSRIITGKLRLDIRQVELSGVIKAAVNSVRLAAQSKTIRIELFLDSDRCEVSGDPDRLKQVIWNLLSNAIKFTPKGGLVQVCLENTGSAVSIRVIDTGPGIEPEFLPHVFEPFRQADGTTTRQHKGLGLGLAIVRDLVELHGGTVSAESDGPGRGSSFSVTLPRTVAADKPVSAMGPDRRKGSSEIAELLGRQRPLEGVRVLVVDDEADARQVITVMLEHSGATTTAVGSVREALEMLDTEKPDVLVADIGMPVEDGYALIRKLRSRADEKIGRTPALALTAYARTEDRVRILAAGYQMHVAKPVEPMELVAAVANLAGRLGYGNENK